MDNNQEQLHKKESTSADVFPDGYEMKWGTNDIPKGMKRRGSENHSSHSGSSHHMSSHSHKHHSHRAHGNHEHSKTSTTTDFQNLLYKDNSPKPKEPITTIPEKRPKPTQKPKAPEKAKAAVTAKVLEKREKPVRNTVRPKHEEPKKKTKAQRIPKAKPAAAKEKKKLSKGKKTGIIAACLLLAILLGGLGFVYGMLNKIGKENSEILPKADPNKTYEDIDKTDQYGVGDISLKPIKQDNVRNILLIGQDRRKGDGARKRSDSMIVATIDLTTNEIKLTSLMRDMYIPVPGYGYGMINATYLNGGMALLNETIEQNFGIIIDGNVEVDFDRFVKLMDLVGPIEIDLNKEEVEYLNKGNGWNLKVGTNTMTSEQVLAYARTRYVGRSDWERTDRQRSVVTKIFNKLRSSDLQTLYSFANKAFPLFKTDLSNTEILQYVYTVISNKMTITQSKRIPVDGTYTQEVKEETLQVLVPKLEPNAQALQKFVYGYSNVEVEEEEKKQEAKQDTQEEKKTETETKKKKSSSLVIDE